MVRGVEIQPDGYGRQRISDILCVGQHDIDINQGFDQGIELGFKARQFIIAGVMNGTPDGTLVFPGEDIPANSTLLPVLFLMKRYEVGLSCSILRPYSKY